MPTKKEDINLIRVILYEEADKEIYNQLLDSKKSSETQNDILVKAFLPGAKEIIFKSNADWMMDLIKKSLSGFIKSSMRSQTEEIQYMIEPLYKNSILLKQLLVFVINQLGETSKNLSDYRNPSEFMWTPPNRIKELVKKTEEKFKRNKEE